MERDKKTDAIKGFAIILVVLGHAIQGNIEDFENNIIAKVIYSFHMPLFMFISGYVASYIKKFDLHFIKKKFKLLVIPFLTWHFISYFLTNSYTKINIIDHFLKLIESPDCGLWFLWVLFINFCILQIAQTVSFKIVLFLYPILCVVGIGLPTSFLGIKQLAWLLPFFFVGYYYAKNKNKIKRYDMIILIISTIVFIGGNIFWGFNIPSFIPYMNKVFSIDRLPYLQSIIIFGFKAIVAFSGIIIVFSVFKLANNLSTLSKLGRYTMDIYVLHFWVLIGFGRGVILVITATIIAITLSLIISHIIRMIPVVRFLLLGKIDTIIKKNYLERF